MAQFEGRVAIVTGAGVNEPIQSDKDQNIGATTAIRFANEGAKVVAVDLKEAWAAHTYDVITKNGGECLAVGADIADEVDCQRVVKAAIDRFGQVDILQNNAATGMQLAGAALQCSNKDWKSVFDVNVFGILNMARAALDALEQSGNGVITNISSGTSLLLHAMPSLAVYNASKVMVNVITRQLARELAAKKIRVNAILPGGTLTPLNKKVSDAAFAGKGDEWIEELCRTIPLGRLGRPDDIADVSLFLASDKASYITGQLIPVDGGLTS